MATLPAKGPLPPNFVRDVRQIRKELNDIWQSLGLRRDFEDTYNVDIPFTFSGALTLVASPGWSPLDDDMTLYEVICTLTTVGTTDTVVTCYKNNVAQGTITVPAGQNFGTSQDIYQNYQAQTDLLTFGATTTGLGAADLVVVARLSSTDSDDLDP